jgi:hypothetical protein
MASPFAFVQAQAMLSWTKKLFPPGEGILSARLPSCRGTQKDDVVGTGQANHTAGCPDGRRPRRARPELPQVGRAGRRETSWWAEQTRRNERFVDALGQEAVVVEGVKQEESESSRFPSYIFFYIYRNFCTFWSSLTYVHQFPPHIQMPREKVGTGKTNHGCVGAMPRR